MTAVLPKPQAAPCDVHVPGVSSTWGCGLREGCAGVRRLAGREPKHSWAIGHCSRLCALPVVAVRSACGGCVLCLWWLCALPVVAVMDGVASERAAVAAGAWAAAKHKAQAAEGYPNVKSWHASSDAERGVGACRLGAVVRWCCGAPTVRWCCVAMVRWCPWGPHGAVGPAVLWCPYWCFAIQGSHRSRGVLRPHRSQGVCPAHTGLRVCARPHRSQGVCPAHTGLRVCAPPTQVSGCVPRPLQLTFSSTVLHQPWRFLCCTSSVSGPEQLAARVCAHPPTLARAACAACPGGCTASCGAWTTSR